MRTIVFQLKKYFDLNMYLLRLKNNSYDVPVHLFSNWNKKVVKYTKK